MSKILVCLVETSNETYVKLNTCTLCVTADPATCNLTCIYTHTERVHTPVPALAQEREDIEAFPDLKKYPFSRSFRLKSTPIFMKTVTFWVQN